MSDEVPDALQMAVELMVTQIENTIVTCMEESLVEMPNQEQREWAHAVAARVFNHLSHSGWGFSLGLGEDGGD